MQMSCDYTFFMQCSFGHRIISVETKIVRGYSNGVRVVLTTTIIYGNHCHTPQGDICEGTLSRFGVIYSQTSIIRTSIIRNLDYPDGDSTYIFT